MEQNASAKIILLIVGVAVLVVGGFLYYAMQVIEQPLPGSQQTETQSQQELSAAGTTDVEADLSGMDLEGLNTELGDMEKEIGQ